MGRILTDKILKKRVSELTVAELVDYFPILNKGRVYRSIKKNFIEKLILKNSNGMSIWDIAKEIGMDYDIVRLRVKELELKELVTINKKLNESNRMTSYVTKVHKYAEDKNEG